MKDNVKRNCVAVRLGDDQNCKYMKRNKYGIPCCSIDGVVGVKWYSCIPSEIKDFIKLKEDVT
jgi:hypothetical protein